MATRYLRRGPLCSKKFDRGHSESGPSNYYHNLIYSVGSFTSLEIITEIRARSPLGDLTLLAIEFLL
jgi:hypothetical protein